MECVGRMGLEGNRGGPGLTSHRDSPTCSRPPTTIPRPSPAGLCPSSRRRPHIRYPCSRGLRGRGRTAGAAGGRTRRGCRSGSPRQWVKVREETAGAKDNDRSQDWREGGPSESSHTLASAGTSYWMYCFLHSGVMCAERCSANFILPFPLHSHPGPAVTGGGGGGNSGSDSSPHGPRRGAALLSPSAAA